MKINRIVWDGLVVAQEHILKHILSTTNRCSFRLFLALNRNISLLNIDSSRLLGIQLVHHFHTNISRKEFPEHRLNLEVSLIAQPIIYLFIFKEDTTLPAETEYEIEL